MIFVIKNVVYFISFVDVKVTFAQSISIHSCINVLLILSYFRSKLDLPKIVAKKIDKI